MKQEQQQGVVLNFHTNSYLKAKLAQRVSL